MNNIKKLARLKRAKRAREQIKRLGIETGVVRLCIHRTPRHIYAQLIAPVEGRILAAASSLELRKEPKVPGKLETAQKVGQLLAQRAQEAGVMHTACDRAGFKYHGRVAALVSAAREHGLQV